MHSLLRAGMKNAGVAAALFSTVLNPVAPLTANAENPSHKPISPIQHVIVIVGENRSFDHLFATYVPKSGESVNNLLSQGIVNADGTPGSHYSRATQYSADITGSTTFQMAPATNKKPYLTLPAPLAGGPTNVCDDNGMCNLGDATSSEDGLPALPAPYYESLLQGGTGLASKVPDSRISGVHNSAPYSTLEPGPFQLTNSAAFPYISYAASPVHRFYQNVAAGRLQCRACDGEKS